MSGNILMKLEVKDVLERYFHALDAQDGVLLASCFSDDVTARYHTGTPGEFGQEGHDQVVGYLVGNMANYKLRTHGAANMEVKVLSADSATSVTHAIAILWKKDKLHFRGIRYEDRLRKTDGEWRICNRKHSPLWQFDADPVAPVVPAPALALAGKASVGSAVA